METVLREAHEAAQRAWHEFTEHLARTGRVSPTLAAMVESQERWVDDVIAAMSIEEWRQDAHHEATHGDLDDLRAADVPLAITDPSVVWHEYLDR